MTGEIEYDNLKYSQQRQIINETLANGTVIERIVETRELNHFPYLAHPLVLTFVIMVNIVMMSLLVASPSGTSRHSPREPSGGSWKTRSF